MEVRLLGDMFRITTANNYIKIALTWIQEEVNRGTNNDQEIHGEKKNSVRIPKLVTQENCCQRLKCVEEDNRESPDSVGETKNMILTMNTSNETRSIDYILFIPAFIQISNVFSMEFSKPNNLYSLFFQWLISYKEEMRVSYKYSYMC